MTYAIFNTPAGLAHARACLKKMAPMALAAAHTEEIRQLAVDILHNVPGKDTTGELQTLYCWVRDNIRYRFDPVGLELVQTPAATLRERSGDCAAMTTLLAALVQSIGHQVKYRTVGPTTNRQAHVQMCAWDGKKWVSMDPVTEPVQPTAAARPNDLGTFGRFARGADHYYEAVGGNMLGFVPNKDEIALWNYGNDGLGFVASPAEEELWMFTPYERHDVSSMGKPNNPVYARDATFGRRMLVARPGTVDRSRANELGAIPVVHNGQRGYLLGAGWTIGKIRVTTDDAKALGAYLNKNSHFLRDSSKEKQGKEEAEFYANKARILSDLQYAATQWARLSNNNRNWIKDHYGPTHSLLHNIVQTGKSLTKTTAGKVATVAAGAVLAPLVPAIATAVPGLVTSSIKPLRAVRDQVLKAVPIPGVAQAVKIEDKFTDAVKANMKDQLPVIPKSVLQAASKVATKATSQLTRAFDQKSGRTVLYTFAGLRGLGATDPAMLKTLAIACVNAVTKFSKSAGQPPQIKLADVTKFQTAEGTLKADGLWGNNSRAACAYYMGVAPSALPAVAKPWAGNAVTWTAPTQAVAPAPAPKPVVVKPAPKPVVVKPSPKPSPAVLPWYRSAQLVSLANAAVAAINKFRAANGNKSPAVKVSQVAAYQSARISAGKAAGDAAAATHKADSLYGAQAQGDMAQTLNKAVSAMPPYNSSLMAKTAKKPAPAPKPVLVKPAAPPAPDPVVSIVPVPQPIVPVPAPKPIVAKPVAKKPAAKKVAVAKKPAKPITVTKPDGSKAVVVPKPDAGGIIDPWAGQAKADSAHSADIIDPWTTTGAGTQPVEDHSERNKWLLLLGVYLYSRRQADRHRRAA